MRSTLVRTLVVATAYWTAGRLALLMAIPPGYATAVWPAAGIALVAVLVWGPRVAIGITLGSFLVNVGTSFDPSSPGTISRSITIALGIAVGATLQATIAARLVGDVKRLGALEDRDAILRLVVLGGPCGSVVSASLGVLVLQLWGVAPPQDLAFSWFTWWTGDSVGVVLVAPILLIATEARTSRRRLLLVGLPLAAGFAVSTFVFLKASSWENARRAAELDQAGAAVVNAIEAKVGADEEIVVSIASFFESSESVERAEFARFVRRHLDRHPEIMALGWDPVVPHAERNAFEQKLRADARGALGIWEPDPATGGRRPASARASYVPIDYLEPAGREDVSGYDVSSDPTRREAIEAAATSLQPTATGKITLLQDARPEPAFLLLAPAHDATSASRPRGYGVGLIRFADLAREAMSESTARDVRVLVSETENGARSDLFDSDPSASSPPEGAVRTTLRVMGRAWLIEVVPLAPRPRSWQAWAVLAGGLMFVCLLGVILMIVTGNESAVARAMNDRTLQAERAARAEEEVRALNSDLESRVIERTGELDAALRTLANSEARFRALFDDSPISLWEEDFSEAARYLRSVDRGGQSLDAYLAAHPEVVAAAAAKVRVLAVNEATLRLYQANSTDQLLAGLTQIFFPRTFDLFREELLALLEGRTSYEGETITRTLAGRENAVSIRMKALEGHERDWSRVVVSVFDLTPQKDAQRLLEASLREKDVLLKEVHHRVKNNLQVISSLLHLQSSRVQNEQARQVFAESQARVESIALLHQHLYQSQNLARIEFGAYIETLTRSLMGAQGRPGVTIEQAPSLTRLFLAVDIAIPCGLICNELVTNALKYAFVGRSRGTIRVRGGRHTGDLVELAIEDDGVGLPAGLDPRHAGSLGLDLVYTLADQIDAAVEVQSSSSGTTFLLRFSAPQ